MSDVSAIVLNKLLTEQNIELWSKLKLVFLDAAFTNLYGAISRFYDKYGKVPSFEDMELVLREGPALVTLATVRLVDAEDISADVALDALIDQYTQNETIKKLDKFLDKLTLYDTVEIKEELSSIVLHLDEKTMTSENVYNMGNLMFFQNHEELARERMHFGLNNSFDAALAGVARQELILIGGGRGSGKSLVCSNLQVVEYESGFVCPYFTIEMVARETNERNMAILAGVNHQHIRQGVITDEEALAIVRARANMFEDAQDLVDRYMRTRDRFDFEARLVREKQLKSDNQLIIIDDRALSITKLDLHLGKLKAKYGNKFRKAIVDYLNQIVLDGAADDQYGWKEQTTVSKKVKDLARKHDIAIFAPYQIDGTGEARFGRGILDAADIALIIEPVDKATSTISMKTTKIRGGPDIEFTSPIDWETLRISPIPVDKPQKSEASADEKKPKGTRLKNAAAKKEEMKQDDSGSDLSPPW